jgi:hypothetical protein
MVSPGVEFVAFLPEDEWTIGHAHAYAEGTDRLAAPLGAKEIPKGGPAIVVASRRRMTADLLERLYGEQQQRAPGLIVGLDEADLAHEVRWRASTIRRTPTDFAAVRLFPNKVGCEVIKWPDRGDASPAGDVGSEVLRALGAGHPLLTISTHSDGLDAFLGGPLAACPRKGEVPGLSPGAPNCASRSGCPRLENRTDGLDAPELVSPRAISCGVLAWITCYGLVDARGPLLPEWSFLERVRMLRQCDAIVTPWNAIVDARRAERALFTRIAAGADLGEAVAHANSAPWARPLGSLLALIGDPRVRFPAVDHPIATSAREAPTPRADRAEKPGLAILRGALKATYWSPSLQATLGPLEARFDTASEQDRAYALFTAARWLPRSFNSWLPLARLVSVHEHLCGGCGSKARSLLFDLAHEQRMVTLCPCCQICADFPAGTEFSATLAGRELTIKRGNSRYGGILEWAHTPANGSLRDLPHDGVYEVGVSNLGAGVRNATVIVSWADSYATVTYRITS